MLDGGIKMWMQVREKNGKTVEYDDVSELTVGGVELPFNSLVATFYGGKKMSFSRDDFISIEQTR